MLIEIETPDTYSEVCVREGDYYYDFKVKIQNVNVRIAGEWFEITPALSKEAIKKLEAKAIAMFKAKGGAEQDRSARIEKRGEFER